MVILCNVLEDGIMKENNMKKYKKEEKRAFEIDIMIDQAADIATSTRETRVLVARMAAKDMPAMLSAQIEKAKQGDTNAFIAVWDRAFGKPVQAIEHSGNDGQPLLFMPLELIQKHNLQVVNTVAQKPEYKIIEAKNTA